ncbi:hypothetical protein NEDG_00179 [Nematocida displodere]|uniref:C2H2-type domain-containing protein n=1 Tax=Nematocida displodere TaxID=1805483 RepID=A0A177EI99_9MICR|nr:hypothetical protein NEDG_00179 [Nematocida displodere]
MKKRNIEDRQSIDAQIDEPRPWNSYQEENPKPEPFRNNKKPKRKYSTRAYGHLDSEDPNQSPFNILANCAAKELKQIIKTNPNLEKENIEYGLDHSDLSEGFDDELDVNFPTIVVGGKKVFKCIFQGCRKFFPSLSRMKRHYIIHTGVKPFRCLNQSCDKSFSRRDNMIQHYKGHCVHSKPETHMDMD